MSARAFTDGEPCRYCARRFQSFASLSLHERECETLRARIRARAPRQWLAVDCNECRRRLVLHGVPYFEHEGEQARARRAYLADHERVSRFVARHHGHELTTSSVDEASEHAGQLALQLVDRLRGAAQ